MSLLLAFAVLLAGPEEMSDAPGEQQQAALLGTVRIVAFYEKHQGTGTGTIVGVDRQQGQVLVLTAQHVIFPPAKRYEVEFYPHTESASRSDDVAVIALSAPADLCLIRASAPKNVPAVLPICPPETIPTGEFPVFTVGCSHGERPSVQVANVLSVNEVEHPGGTGRFWKLDREPVPGRSGGPVVGPAGQVIGVCLGRGSHAGFYAHTAEIHALCRAANAPELYRSAVPTKRELTASATAGPLTAKWLNPGRYEASVEVDLLIDLTDTCDLPFPESLEFDVQAQPSTVRLNGDSRRLRFNNPGRTPARIAFTLPLHGSTPIELTLRPVKLPPWAQLAPDQLRVTIAVTPPPAVTTTIAATAVRVSQPQWVSLKEATAEFAADLQVTVSGPLGDRTLVALQAPVGIRSLSLSPQVVRPGQQTVRLRAVASIRPGQQHDFLFRFEAQQQGAINIRSPQPVRVVATAPPPARVALLQDGHLRRRLTARKPIEGASCTIIAEPTVMGLTDRHLTQELTVALRPSPAIRILSEPTMPVFATGAIQLAPTATTAASYFRDSTIEAELSVEPAATCLALEGTTHQVHLVSEARFKRHLLLLAGGLLAILMVYLPYRFWWRLNHYELQEEH